MKFDKKSHTPLEAQLASDIFTPLPKETYFRLASSPLTKLIYEAFTAGPHFDRLADGKAEVNHKVFFDVQEEDGKTVFEYQNSRGTLFFSLPTNCLKEGGKTRSYAKKLFVILLIEWNRQQEADVVTIPLHRFYKKYAAYSKNNHTHRGLKKAIPLLAFISVWGNQKISKYKGRKAEHIQLAEKTPLFDRLSLSNGELKFSVNPSFKAKKKLIFEFFPSLPTFFFNLSSNAADMLFHIFYIARQNLDTLERRKPFAVSFKAVHVALCLPKVQETHHHKQLIIQPLIDAVEEINRQATGTGLSLAINGKPSKTTAEILNAYKIEASITGEMLVNYQPMIERVKAEQEKAASYARKKERQREEKLKAINL